MKRQHISHLEQNLERLIEGAFSNFFGRKMHPNDIALQIARAMEDTVRPAEGSDPRLIAPDHYTITIAPSIHQYLLETKPEFPQAIGHHVTELANHAQYRLLAHPTINLITSKSLDEAQVSIQARHTTTESRSTVAMQRVIIPENTNEMRARLIIGNGMNFELDTVIINIGRHASNNIILDDPTASRHHIQLRLRDSKYMLFDLNSRSGTYVNDTPVKEHHLRSGDIITVGQTRILYMEDDEKDIAIGKTDSFDPIGD